MLGPPGIPVRNLFLNFSLFDLYDILVRSDQIYRLPDTPLRFLVFISSIIFFISVIFKKYYNNNESKVITKILPYIIFSFILTLLVTDGIYNYFAIILVLMSLYYSLVYSKNNLTKLELAFLSSYLLFFILPFCSSLYHSTSFAEIDNYLRFILVIPVYLTIRNINISFNQFITTINIASILIGILSLYFLYIEGETRVKGFTSSAVIFGNISLVFCFISFLTISVYKKSIILFPIIASASAFFAWASTGSRGSVIFLILFILLLFTKPFRETLFFTKKLILYILLLPISIIFINPQLVDRFTNAQVSTYNYLVEDSSYYWQHKDSIVPRVNIWKASIFMIKDNPLTGIGLDNFNESLSEQINLNNVQPIRPSSNKLTDGQNHAHNQYLDIFAKTGIFGFIILMFYLMIHIYFFYWNYYMSSNNTNSKFLSLFGITSSIGYMLYMLTHSILSHQLSTLFMTLLFIILSGMITNNRRNI